MTCTFAWGALLLLSVLTPCSYVKELMKAAKLTIRYVPRSLEVWLKLHTCGPHLAMQGRQCREHLWAL